MKDNAIVKTSLLTEPVARLLVDNVCEAIDVLPFSSVNCVATNVDTLIGSLNVKESC